MGERRSGRSVGALFAGFLVVVVLSVGTDVALQAAGIFPALGQRMPDRLLLLAFTYRTLYSVAGSYIVARLAPNRPMQHALISGVVGLVLRYCGRRRDMERRTSLRAQMVSAGAHRDGDAIGLGGRPAVQHDVAR